MAKRYVPRKMSARELQEFEQILLEQVDVQRWFVVRVVVSMAIEILINLQ